VTDTVRSMVPVARCEAAGDGHDAIVTAVAVGF